MNVQTLKRTPLLAQAAVLVFAVLAPIFISQMAHAAALTKVLVRFDRMQISTATTGLVCAAPNAASIASTEGQVVVTYPTGYTLGAFGTFTVGTANLPAGATAWPGIAAPTSSGNISGQSVTFGSGDLTSSSALYCFNWTTAAAVTVKGTATDNNLGSVATQTSGSVGIDTAQYATSSLSNDSVLVTATVPIAFTFSLSGNTDSIGSLSTASVSASPTPRIATINTNAKNGWTVYAKDTNAGLTSASAAYTVPSNCAAGAGTNTTLASGTEGYNMGVGVTQTGGSQTPTAAAVFLGGSTGKGGGLCSSNFQPIANSTGTANNAQITMTNNVAISSTTAAAADYTDTIYVVGAGLF